MAPHNPPSHDHSHTHQICTHITPIPLPADDCDRVHSMHAALSSLDAATASFDAAVDALSATTARHRRRVVDLERRMARFRECLRRLDDVASSRSKDGGLDDKVVMLFCPGSYAGALKGMELELAEVREELDPSNDAQWQEDVSDIPGSSLDCTTQFGVRECLRARAAADAAVQKALLRDVQTDNGQAVPSDAWLDHASTGLGVRKALEATDEQRAIPLLLGEDVGGGEAEYRRALDALALNASAKQEGFDRLDSLEESPVAHGGGRGDDETFYSTTSQISTISVASSTRMTAGQRRRWHKQQQLQSLKAGRSRASSALPTTLFPHPEAPSSGVTPSAAAGRRQSLAGSHPYLCEAFHDSYGIGPAPARGLVDCSGFSSGRSREGGVGFYPPSSHVTDLLVFNTTRNSYGLAKSATNTSTAKSGKEGGEEKDNRPRNDGAAGLPALPNPVARKSQSGGGAINKPTLANLVFKADASEAKSAGPALDLPASLPHELSG